MTIKPGIWISSVTDVHCGREGCPSNKDDGSIPSIKDHDAVPSVVMVVDTTFRTLDDMDRSVIAAKSTNNLPLVMVVVGTSLG